MPTTQSGPKPVNGFDWKVIMMVCAISGGTGIGGSMLTGSGNVEEEQFKRVQAEIRREVQVLEERSEKRYKRGLELGKHIEGHTRDIEREMEEVRIKMAVLEEKVNNLK